MTPLLPLALAVASAKLAIVGATVEVGDGTTLADATVLVDGDVIAAVGKDLPIPPDAKRLDGQGRVVTPGLVQVGSQVGLFDVGLEAPLDDAGADSALTPALRVGDAYNPLSFRVACERDEGVTTALLAPTGGRLIMGSAHVVELRTAVDVVPSPPVGMVGAYSGHVGERHGGSRAQALLALRTALDDARLYDKNRAAFERAQLRPLSLDKPALEALLPIALGQAPLFVAVDRAADIRAVLLLAREQKLKLVITSGQESWLLASELKAQGVPVVVYPSWAGERGFDSLHARDDLAAVLAAAGVTVIVGTWGTENGTTRLRQEAGIAVQNGLPRAAALATITSAPARLLGLDVATAKDKRSAIGTVTAGARANLVVWSGDPLETRTLVERVLIGGALQEGDTRQRALEKKYLRALKDAHRHAADAVRTP
jgi:imidazolonepropionase-like amidohydrolase